MRDPKRMLLWMLFFLAAVGIVCAVLFVPLRQAFEANQIFNGLILSVLLIGIVITMTQVITLDRELDWIDTTEAGEEGVMPEQAPRLLAPMAKMFMGRDQQRFQLSAMATRSLLDGIRLRLDESRDISSYMTGLLIFLGLLGTFWGLLDTIGGVGQIIAGLSTEGGELNLIFDNLKRDLAGPLTGMGTAFSSSLFGLAGALVLGVLDLQAGHAQNRFYNRLEEWLSTLTHLHSGAFNVDGEQPLPRYIGALLEQTADNLDKLQRTMVRGEEDRRVEQENLFRLTEKLAELTDQMRSEQKLILNLTKDQMDLRPAMADLALQVSSGLASYEEMRDHLRNVDVCLARLLDEVSDGRRQFLDEFHNEFKLLAQSIGRNSRPDL